MDGPQYLTVDAPVVAAAGRGTAGTAMAWRSWGHRIRSRFAVAGESVVSTRLAHQLSEYALVRQPQFDRIAAEVTALGTGTSSAAATVAGADAESAAQLRQQTTRLLRRPVNSLSAPD